MKPCWAQYLLWLTLTLAGVSAMLSGCGQDGPLYLPDDTESQEEKDKQ
jgi:predicted small lipoprotein YifL